MITIVDYRSGNIGSIQNMLHKLGHASVISHTLEEINSASKLILAGVGAFDTGMQNLADLDLIEPLRRRAIEEKVPILGICLGMQLLTLGSEEGQRPGLGLVKADTKKFVFEDVSLRVPHVGWNLAKPLRSSRLLVDLYDESRFYFTHSYYVKPHNDVDRLLETHYGIDFASGVEHDNVFGVQFHPEKSHKFGMRILDSFARL